MTRRTVRTGASRGGLAADHHERGDGPERGPRPSRRWSACRGSGRRGSAVKILVQDHPTTATKITTNAVVNTGRSVSASCVDEFFLVLSVRFPEGVDAAPAANNAATNTSNDAGRSTAKMPAPMIHHDDHMDETRPPLPPQTASGLPPRPRRRTANIVLSGKLTTKMTKDFKTIATFIVAERVVRFGLSIVILVVGP